MNKYLIVAAIAFSIACVKPKGETETIPVDTATVAVDTIVADTIGVDSLLIND